LCWFAPATATATATRVRACAFHHPPPETRPAAPPHPCAPTHNSSLTPSTPLLYLPSFIQGLFVFIRAVQTLTSHNKGVVVVGLAGPSGSGKTVFSAKLQALIPGCAVLSMDNYNDASRLVDGNFDDPRLTDYDTLLANVGDLKAGRATLVPIYDFKSSSRVGYREVAVPASRIVIIEGIYALSARVRPLLDLRVSVTGGVHFDLVKRVLRDITRSGQAPEEIIQQISDTVYPMYKAYIEPDLKSAHLRIYNTFNPFTGFMDATYILKSEQPVSDEAVKAVLAGLTGGAASAAPSATASPTAAGVVGTPASTLSTPHTGGDGSSTANDRATAADSGITTIPESETYDIYLLPPGEDPETCSSWLRMRNRDGRYSLMFEEWVVDGPFIISPRITFEVSVRVLGGLMALGYEIGTIMKRTSRGFKTAGGLTVKLDTIEGMPGRAFVQVQGKDRAGVAAAGAALGLDGHYLPRSYIEMVQLERLTESFRAVTDDLRRRFAVGGDPLFDSDGGVTPPSGRGGRGMGVMGGGGRGSGGRGGGGTAGRAPGVDADAFGADPFPRTTGFAPLRPGGLASSAPTDGGGAALLGAWGGAGGETEESDTALTPRWTTHVGGHGARPPRAGPPPAGVAVVVAPSTAPAVPPLALPTTGGGRSSSSPPGTPAGQVGQGPGGHDPAQQHGCASASAAAARAGGGVPGTVPPATAPPASRGLRGGVGSSSSDRDDGRESGAGGWRGSGNATAAAAPLPPPTRAPLSADAVAASARANGSALTTKLRVSGGGVVAVQAGPHGHGHRRSHHRGSGGGSGSGGAGAAPRPSSVTSSDAADLGESLARVARTLDAVDARAAADGVGFGTILATALVAGAAAGAAAAVVAVKLMSPGVGRGG